jgi:hypothetical protein
VGADLLRIAFAFYERMDVRVLMRPTLDALRDEVNETIHLGVLDGASVVYVDKLEPSGRIVLPSPSLNGTSMNVSIFPEGAPRGFRSENPNSGTAPMTARRADASRRS